MKITENFIKYSIDNDIIINNFVIPAQVVKASLLVVIAAVIFIIAIMVILPLLERFFRKTETKLDDVLIERKFFKRAFHLFPAIVLSIGLPTIFDSDSQVFDLISRALNLYYIIIIYTIFESCMNIANDYYDMNKGVSRAGITGIVQALKIVGLILAIIFAISVLAGKSPAFFITGLGAFTAILMLVFKDAILGLVAGIQLSAMDLIRKGDWIDIPKHGVDGDVVEISLTSIKVRNFDMTFTVIPAYELVASSFKNWRGMSESGGRRIKRSIWFSLNSIHFINDEDMEQLLKIKLLRPYFEKRLAEIQQFNESELSEYEKDCFVNGRRLTNIGTFRIYVETYLKNHPGIHKEMTIMVRQLAHTELGLPLEIYAFTNDVRWVAHENIQSNIFDHLLASAPQFGLVVYQRDLREN
ncbi:MAG: mechanosensitive ion channel family protein [Marinilabiliaceae bacterium]|nr:mechanosensitive ion channel family protein [Marinilabiliaceae bacterium]